MNYKIGDIVEVNNSSLLEDKERGRVIEIKGSEVLVKLWYQSTGCCKFENTELRLVN